MEKLLSKLKPMKKILSVAVVSFLISLATQSWAQVQVGLTAAFSFNKTNFKASELQSESNLVFKSATGAELGVFARIPAGFIYAKPMATISFLRGTVTENADNDNESDDFNLSTLEVPLLVGLQLLPFISIEGGPSWNYLIDHSENTNGVALSFSKNTLGYRAGAVIDLGKVGVFGHYGGILTKNEGSQIDLQRPSRIIVGVKVKL